MQQPRAFESAPEQQRRGEGASEHGFSFSLNWVLGTV